MTQKKDLIIGVRFTKEEKEEIDKYIGQSDINITEFVRLAIKSYLNNFTEDSEALDVRKIFNFSNIAKVSSFKVRENLKRFTSSLNNLLSSVNEINKELYMYDHKKVVQEK